MACMLGETSLSSIVTSVSQRAHGLCLWLCLVLRVMHSSCSACFVVNPCYDTMHLCGVTCISADAAASSYAMHQVKKLEQWG